ncbi:hybrid sensor histidine kinase/response regulator transcription factor [Pinibacter aurantiacus]|uniref:histidine kinase n=1 Tax=Pinibacter aurantiacus TaxID=2851599 RepID=A0A9E2SD74_9BACT|nr:hybrid sensor histidine kinase/response regulator transcription factor [Pinibacter aurantiacus]MBV4360551.1 response regulator [Pinibacter aurantiacus]
MLFLKMEGQNIAFNHLTVEHGLSNNAVLSITQDKQGFMWYGTSNGLNRYDGHVFKVYKMNTADSTTLSSDNILSLFCDKSGTLWAGTSNGLNQYDPKNDAFIRVPLKINNEVVNGRVVHCVYEDRKSNLWVGTQNGVYLLTDRQNFTCQPFLVAAPGNPGNTIYSIFEDHAGQLWVGTNNGLTKMKWVNGALTNETYRHDPANPGSISANYITSIVEDPSDNLWIGTQNSGVNLYNPLTGSFSHFSHSTTLSTGIINNNIRQIIADKAGKIWVATQEGLSIIEPFGGNIHSYQHDISDKKSLSQNSIYSLFVDANGSVWLGTYFGGVNIIYSYNTSFTILQNKDNRFGINNNVVSSIVEDGKHNLWIGTEGGGLNYFDRTNGVCTIYKNKQNDASSLGSNLIKVICSDKDGNIWAGTHGGGLNLFDAGSKTFKRFLFTGNDLTTLNSEILALLDDSQGRFWVGSNNGLYIYRRKDRALEPFDRKELKGATVNGMAKALLEDSKKRIWIGTVSGLYVLENNEIKVVNSEYQINCIKEDISGNIWLGLYNGGLAMYDAAKRDFIYYTEKQGLPNNNVLGILEADEKTLWLSTDNGLVKFVPSQKSAQTYTVSDGLAGNEFNYNSFYKDSRGEFFFGGYNGLTSFFPDKIETNKYAAPIAFTGLKLFNKPVGINGDDGLLQENIGYSKDISFRYNQNVFTIEYALLNFIKSNKNRYAYKLEGFDKNWNEVTSTSATYTNLPSGTYTFMVKGANNDGVWSEPAILKINILPPFWRTWWAYGIYVLILATIVFFVTRFFFLGALLKKEEELHQAKLNLFTNISHEIRTHLTLIMTPMDKMLDREEKDSMTYQQLTNVKGNANRLLKLVSELMDFRKAESNHLKLHVTKQDLIPFLQDIYASFQELSLAKKISISFLHNAESVSLYFDKEQLEKVFFNLLTNAFKFTPEGGQILLNVEQKQGSVQVTVTDNGRGIAPQYIDNLFTNFFQVADHGMQNTGYGIGLALSKNIVELHKGTIAIESDPASSEKQGKTCFTVTLLPGNKHFENSQLTSEATHDEKAIETEHKQVKPLTSDVSSFSNDSDKPYTILITEDNADLRAIIRETFEGKYQILESVHGLQGWETAIEQIPDLIISDVMMPQMDGFQLCQQLKTDERTSHIPVILLTAKSSQTDQVSGLETGADLYLTKPFSTKILELNVRNLLSSREKMRHKFSLQINPASIENAVAEMVEETYVNPVDKEFLDRVIKLIEDHMDDPAFGVDMLSKKVGMSQPVLYKKLKAVTSMSVNDFVKSLRMKHAAHLLQQKHLAVYEIAYTVGYSDSKYFSKEFKKIYGKSPSEYAD